MSTTEINSDSNTPQKVTFPATVAARILAKVKPSQRYGIARKLILTQIGILAETSTQREDYANHKFFANALAKTGRWIREAAAISKISLPLDILEKSVYSQIEDVTGLNLSNLTGLISKTTNPSADNTIKVNDNRLARKFAKTLAPIFETSRRPYHNSQTHHGAAITPSYKANHHAPSLQH